MRMFLISDNIDTQVGLRLAGIRGIVVHEREDVLKALKVAKEDREIGIVLITEKLSALIADELKVEKIQSDIPLIVEIPDRHGTIHSAERITRYIKEAIGLKI